MHSGRVLISAHFPEELRVQYFYNATYWWWSWGMVHKLETAFRKNPWHYAKSACEHRSQKEPTCSMECVYNHFSKTCADENHYHELPSWIEVMPVSDDDLLSEFYLSPVTPGLIKGILKSRSLCSSPGDDGISYHHLKKMLSSYPPFPGDPVLKDPIWVLVTTLFLVLC